MGLFDSQQDDKAANAIMADLGFDESPQVVEEPTPAAIEPQVEYQTESQEQPQEQTEEAVELSEVERRLAKAQLYKQMISGSLFDGEGAIVSEVEQEFHDFARKQLQILMGLSVKEVAPAPVEPVFTEDEISVLRYLIESVRTRLEAQKTQPQKQPKTPAKPPRTVGLTAPLVKPPAKEVVVKQQKPKLRTRAVPEEVPQEAKPAPKKTTTSKPLPPITLPPKLAIPADGSEIVDSDGLHYRIRHVEMSDPDEYGIMDGTKIRKLPDQGTCVLSNGIQVAKQGTSILKIIKTQLTSTASVPGRLPFPDKNQMEVMTAALSQQQAQSCLPPSLGSILHKK